MAAAWHPAWSARAEVVGAQPSAASQEASQEPGTLLSRIRQALPALPEAGSDRWESSAQKTLIHWRKAAAASLRSDFVFYLSADASRHLLTTQSLLSPSAAGLCCQQHRSASSVSPAFPRVKYDVDAA